MFGTKTATPEEPRGDDLIDGETAIPKTSLDERYYLKA
jgi:hypothetical protein